MFYEPSNLLLLQTSQLCHKHAWHKSAKNLIEFCNYASVCKSYKMTLVPSNDSDQTGHPPGLIRVFAVRVKIRKHLLSFEPSAHTLSDLVGVQADLSLRSANTSFVGLVFLWLGVLHVKENCDYFTLRYYRKAHCSHRVGGIRKRSLQSTNTDKNARNSVFD